MRWDHHPELIRKHGVQEADSTFGFTRKEGFVVYRMTVFGREPLLHDAFILGLSPVWGSDRRHTIPHLARLKSTLRSEVQVAITVLEV